MLVALALPTTASTPVFVPSLLITFEIKSLPAAPCPYTRVAVLAVTPPVVGKNNTRMFDLSAT